MTDPPMTEEVIRSVEDMAEDVVKNDKITVSVRKGKLRLM